ncbi:hypothetical protein [Fusobacterium sp.]|uniref:hypothetical protein n=1 Tax=Fusobacterium sp. TaxID=68766 RepID=UPI00261181E8|nr:hypothetical protein [Fusobacterium sp.]
MLQGITIRCRKCGKLETISICNGPSEIERFFFNEKTGDFKKIIEKCKFKDEILLKREKKSEENEKVLKLSKNFKELKTLNQLETAAHMMRCKICKERTSFEITGHIFKR